ncbi:MAG: hydrogenase nickel incorporation protein HypB [Xanthomonadaceae bacterium]|nr:hydrogenase nickel incorporation protein HypB [Xanthomonadaceae bacterium]
MCDQCGCHLPVDGANSLGATNKTVTLTVNQRLLAANDAQATVNRRYAEKLGAVAINLISGPGSGKTALLERTIDELGKELKIGVLEGDIETERDADRIRAHGIPVVPLTTGGACHLDAPLVYRGLQQLEELAGSDGLDIVFIENVGNLVCPATFDLGEHFRVVLLSVPEGSDKPAKYPRAFLTSQIFMVTKTDLLPYFDFSLEEVKSDALGINPSLQILSLSATSGEGVHAWVHWLQEIVKDRKLVLNY